MIRLFLALIILTISSCTIASNVKYLYKVRQDCINRAKRAEDLTNIKIFMMKVSEASQEDYEIYAYRIQRKVEEWQKINDAAKESCYE